MRIITTDKAPAPIGHYSQGVVHGGLCFASGMLPITPAGERLGDKDIETQARQCLDNLLAVIEAAGGKRESVLKVTAFLADMELFGRVNAVYAEFFGEHRPARAVVPCRNFAAGMLIEIEAVAAV